jgi:hypothetical protein
LHRAGADVPRQRRHRQAQFGRLGLCFGLVYFVGLVAVVYPWLGLLRH